MPRSSPPHPPSGARAGLGAMAERAQSFRRRLLNWYARAARDLPWRRTRDPYRVLVSAAMLQQTQVSRVEQFYPRFLARFPDFATPARARPPAVREAGHALGSSRRTRTR